MTLYVCYAGRPTNEALCTRERLTPSTSMSGGSPALDTNITQHPKFYRPHCLLQAPGDLHVAAGNTVYCRTTSVLHRAGIAAFPTQRGWREHTLR